MKYKLWPMYKTKYVLHNLSINMIILINKIFILRPLEIPKTRQHIPRNKAGIPTLTF